MHVCFFYCIYLVYCQRWEKACQTSIMYHFLKIKNIYTDIYNYKTFNLCIGFFVFLYYIYTQTNAGSYMLKMLCILSVVRQGGVIWTSIISGTSFQPVKYSPHPCQCFMYIAFIRISEYSDRSAFTNIWNTSIKCILDSDMVPSKLFFTLSTNAINLSQKAITFWVNLKKKKIQNPE